MALHWRTTASALPRTLVRTACGACQFGVFLPSREKIPQTDIHVKRLIAVIQQFGTKLRRLRQGHGLTLRELAAALGYAGTGYLSDIEFGKKYPTADLILKVSRFFGVSMDQLAKDELDLDIRDVLPDDTP